MCLDDQCFLTHGDTWPDLSTFNICPFGLCGENKVSLLYHPLTTHLVWKSTRRSAIVWYIYCSCKSNTLNWFEQVNIDQFLNTILISLMATSVGLLIILSNTRPESRQLAEQVHKHKTLFIITEWLFVASIILDNFSKL